MEIGTYLIKSEVICPADKVSTTMKASDDPYTLKSTDRDHGKSKGDYEWAVLFKFKDNNLTEAQPSQQSSTIIDIDEQYTELLSQYLHTPLLISEENCTYLDHVRPICWISPKPTVDLIYDLVIIGAGQRSIEIAKYASMKGLKVALIEKRFLGGKYWNSTHYPLNYLSNHLKLLDKLGYPISMESFEKGLREMFEKRKNDSKTISANVLTNKFGIDLYFGQATFTKTQCLVVNKMPIPFRKCIIATGSNAKSDEALKNIPKYSLEELLNNSKYFHSVLIFGGQIDAALIAQILLKFQCHVTLCLPTEKIEACRPLSKAIRNSLDEIGVEILENTTVSSATFKKSENDQFDIECSISSGNCVETIKCNGVLALTYQKNVHLGLDNIQVLHDSVLGIIVNEYFQTNNPHIYAIGSACSNQDMCLYSPNKIASIILANAFSNKKKQAKFPYFVMHSFPEILFFGHCKCEFKDKRTITKHRLSFGKIYLNNEASSLRKQSGANWYLRYRRSCRTRMVCYDAGIKVIEKLDCSFSKQFSKIMKELKSVLK